MTLLRKLCGLFVSWDGTTLTIDIGWLMLLALVLFYSC